MAVELPEQVGSFLRRPNPAVMAVVRQDGRPLSVATWYLYVDGEILVNLQADRARARHLHPSAPVSLTVLADGDWYRHVSLWGRVREVVPDEGYADADRLSDYYAGVPHTPRGADRISVRIGIDGWHGWRVGD